VANNDLTQEQINAVIEEFKKGNIQDASKESFVPNTEPSYGGKLTGDNGEIKIEEEKNTKINHLYI